MFEWLHNLLDTSPGLWRRVAAHAEALQKHDARFSTLEAQLKAISDETTLLRALAKESIKTSNSNLDEIKRLIASMEALWKQDITPLVNQIARQNDRIRTLEIHHRSE